MNKSLLLAVAAAVVLTACGKEEPKPAPAAPATPPAAAPAPKTDAAPAAPAPAAPAGEAKKDEKK